MPKKEPHEASVSYTGPVGQKKEEQKKPEAKSVEKAEPKAEKSPKYHEG